MVTIFSFFSLGFFSFSTASGELVLFFFPWYGEVLGNRNKSLKVNKLMPGRFLSSLLSVQYHQSKLKRRQKILEVENFRKTFRAPLCSVFVFVFLPPGQTNDHVVKYI